MTLMDLAIVLAVLAILALIALNGAMREQDIRTRVLRLECLNNLRAVGSAFRVWADDHNGNFPMSLSQTNGGSSEFITGMNAYRHFQVMSNELATPKVLLCPGDWTPGSTHVAGKPAPSADFTYFGNSNLSFFVGVDVRTTNGTMLLSGDRNITNGTAVKNGLLEVTTNMPAGWTVDPHDHMGNVLFADGSVQRMNSGYLRLVLPKTGLATNRLQMPVTIP